MSKVKLIECHTIAASLGKKQESTYKKILNRVDTGDALSDYALAAAVTVPAILVKKTANSLSNQAFSDKLSKKSADHYITHINALPQYTYQGRKYFKKDDIITCVKENPAKKKNDNANVVKNLLKGNSIKVDESSLTSPSAQNSYVPPFFQPDPASFSPSPRAQNSYVPPVYQPNPASFSQPSNAYPNSSNQRGASGSRGAPRGAPSSRGNQNQHNTLSFNLPDNFQTQSNPSPSVRGIAPRGTAQRGAMPSRGADGYIPRGKF